MFRLSNIRRNVFRILEKRPLRTARSRPMCSALTREHNHTGFAINKPQTALLIKIRAFSSVLKDQCWKCDHVMSTDDVSLFCPNCRVLQKAPTDLTYFEIFDLAPEYNLVAHDLTTKFRELQSVLHPDKFSTKSDEEKVHSDDWSALVNRAYKTLLVPMTRAEYFLHLNGVSIPEDNSALDAEFLMEMMEKNEEIEEAESEKDLMECKGKIQEEMKSLLFEMEEALVTGYFEQAVRTIIRMRYLCSIANSIKEKGEKLEDRISIKSP